MASSIRATRSPPISPISRRACGAQTSAGLLSKKASFFVDFNRRDVQNNSLIVAQYFDPQALTQSSINTSVLSPSSFMVIAPRLDYALSANNTLTVRVEERLNSAQNAGLGGTRLAAPYSQLAYNSKGNGQNVMVTESSILSSKIVNETRFQYFRNYNATPGNMLPQINVSGAFITGGNGFGDTHDLSRTSNCRTTPPSLMERKPFASEYACAAMAIRAVNPAVSMAASLFWAASSPCSTPPTRLVYDSNGNPLTVTLTSLQQYERNVLLSQAGLGQAQIQALGGGPSRFNIQAGQSYISAERWDAGPFIQDDWRARPNFTLSLGLRYEVQTLAGGGRDIAPRLGFAWAPGKPGNGRAKDGDPRRLRHFLRPHWLEFVRNRGVEQRSQSTPVHRL